MTRPQAALARKLWAAALLIGLPGWWVLVLTVPATVPWFMPSVMPPEALWAFAVPDLICTVTAAISLLASGTEDRPKTWWMLSGAHVYSGLWVLAATLMTGEAWLGTGLMMGTAAITLQLAWTDQPEDQWFRVADEEPTWWSVLKSLGHAVTFDGVFLVVIPLLLFWVQRDLGLPSFSHGYFWPILGGVVALNVVSIACGTWMAIHGKGTPLPTDTARELVVSGPYRWVRNPMAALGILEGILLGVALGSPLVMAYSAFGAVLWHGFVRPIEERDLEQRFGESYRAYRSSVRLWIPGIGLR